MSASPTLRSEPPAHAQLDAPAVWVCRASRVFGAVRALSDVSFTVQRCEVHALLGPNGAGKTTLVRLVSGLVDPSSGEIEVLGRSTRSHARDIRRQIGYVPSGSRSFYLRVSGLENLVFFGRLYGLRHREARRRAEEEIERVGLAQAAHRAVSTYSQGMQRRLAIARALVHRPPILLVDEATHDLDPEGAHRIQQLVREAAAGGAAVIWTTQRLDEVNGFATRATLLAQGTTRFTGPIGDLLAQADVRRFVVRIDGAPGHSPDDRAASLSMLVSPRATVRAFPEAGESSGYLLSLADGAVLGDVIAAIARAGISVQSCSEESSRIETAFLRLTGTTG